MVHNEPLHVLVSEVEAVIRKKIMGKKLVTTSELVRLLFNLNAYVPNDRHWVLLVEPSALTCVGKGKLFLN